MAGSALDTLERVSGQLSAVTGFSQVSIVMHILTGLAPVLPGATLTIRHRGAEFGEVFITRREAVIELRPRDVSYEQFREDLRPREGGICGHEDQTADAQTTAPRGGRSSRGRGTGPGREGGLLVADRVKV